MSAKHSPVLVSLSGEDPGEVQWLWPKLTT